jgi:hypothetical protein
MTDRIKRAHFQFWREAVDGQKITSIFFKVIFNPTHHSLHFCVLFLAVGADLVRKCCGKKLGGHFGQFIAKSLL